MKSNEQIIKEHIDASGAEALTVEWVKWMLDTLSRANEVKERLNPEWLHASLRRLGDTEPPMIYK